MATKKTISSNFVTVPKKYGGKKSGTHEVELAYITAEEAEKLKRLDMHNSGIGKEMHYGPKGIPNYDGDGGGTGPTPDDPGQDDTLGEEDEDTIDDEGGNGDDGGDAEKTPEEECNAKDGWHWDSETNTCVKDEDKKEEEKDVDESWEKAPKYTPVGEKDRIPKPLSETERVEDKRIAGTTFADTVAANFKGEVKGLGAKSAELRGMDISKDALAIQTAAAQDWAARGMSFSTPMLHSEEEMIRKLARDRLINEDQAQAMQSKLDLQAWKNSEPIQKLAAASKFKGKDPALALPGFQPGAINVAEVMDPDFSNITLPGFSGLPKNISKIFSEHNDNPLFELAENITDPAGNVCDYKDLDENGYCPVTAQENIMDWLPVVFKFLGFLSGSSASKAALAIQKAQFALQMAESADQEKIARRQVKRATDQANMLLAKSDLKDNYQAALQDLSDKGVTDAQKIADDFAKVRSDIGVEKFGASGDTQRKTKLSFLEDARKTGMLDAVGTEASIGGQFSGAGVAGVPSAWAAAFNKSAKGIHKEMGDRASLRAALGSTQDMDLMTAEGMTGLEGADLGEDAMMKGLGVDYETAQDSIETAMRKKVAKTAQKGHDIDYGYTLPTTVMGGIDPALTGKFTQAQNQQAMFSGLGDIASSIYKINNSTG